MERQQKQPIAAPVLRAVADSVPDGDGQPEAIAQGATVVPFAPHKRAASAVMDAAAELWLHPDRLIHSAWNGRPESMAQHYAYMTSFAWVPKEVTGKKATAWKWAGIAYHVFIAWPLKAFAKALDAAAGRPLLMLGLLVFLAILIVLLFVL